MLLGVKTPSYMRLGMDFKEPGRRGPSFRFGKAQLCPFSSRETLALRSALLAAQEAHISHIVCYSDFQPLLGFLNSGGSSNEPHNILNDVRSISSSFVSISFVFIPRAFNSVADSLVKKALVTDLSSSFN